MSFESILEITELLAVQDTNEYPIAAVDIRMDLGGTSKATFTVVPQTEGDSSLTDLTEFTETSGSVSHVSFSRGSWVSLVIRYKLNDTEAETEFELFAGRVSAVSDKTSVSGTSVTVQRGYTLVSDLDFIDRLPLGSLYVPSPLAKGQFIPSTFIETSQAEGLIYSKVQNSGSVNIAKLTAELIDVKTTAGAGGITAETAEVKNKIQDRVNVDGAPVLAGAPGVTSLAKSIATSVAQGYTTTSPCQLFKNILSKFFLICAPRTHGWADVVENNGWRKKTTSKQTIDIGYDLVTGVNMFDSTSGYPGFDAIAVDLMPPPKGTGAFRETQYMLCTEVLDNATSRPKLIFGPVTCKQSTEGLELTKSSGDKITVGKVKIIHLPDWMQYVSMQAIADNQVSDAYESQESLNTWAKWLAAGTYGELNRVSNRVVLELRLAGYMEIADKLGEILSFYVPGAPKQYYGRLTGVGITVSTGPQQLSGKAMAIFDCIRDETDNDNLCVDFSLYK